MVSWTERILAWLNVSFSSLLENILVALIIILIGFIIARVLGKVTAKFLKELEVDKLLKKATGIRFSLEGTITYFVRYFIYFVTIVMALNQIGLTTTLLYMISGAVIILVVLSIFLGIKDFIPNVLAGMFIHRRGFLHVGDKIKFKDIEGKIIKINLVETRVETKSGDIIAIPNSNLTKSEVIKKRSGKKRHKKK